MGPLEKGIDHQVESESPAKLGKLPPECPNCGGSVHSDEIEWTDSRSALCDTVAASFRQNRNDFGGVERAVL